MKVSDIMDRKLVAVSPTTSIGAALKMLKSSGVNLLVMVESGKLHGTIEEDDLNTYISSNPAEKMKEQVRTIAKRPVFVEAGESIESAIEKTMENNLTRLPVVDSVSSMRCVGIVTASELLKASAAGK